MIDLVRRLRDADAVAVEHREDAADAARDAAVVQAEVGEGVERALAERADVGHRLPAGGGGRRHRRDLAVRRIDDERRVAERADAELVAQEGLLVDRPVAGGFVAAGPAGELLRRERLARAHRRLPRRRNAAHVVARPDAVEIRMPPRGARRLPVGILGLRGRGLRRDRPQRGWLDRRTEPTAPTRAPASGTPGWSGNWRLFLRHG